MSEYSAFVGIDVSQKSLDLVRWQGGKPWQRPNTPRGWQQVIADLRQDPNPLVVLEATGPFHQGLVVALAAAGCLPAVMNPWHIKHFAQSLKRGAKTDRSDAQVLAQYGAQVQPIPRPLPPVCVRTLNELVSRRNGLVTIQTMEKNRLSAPGHLPSVHASLTRSLAALASEIKLVDQEIARIIKADPDLQYRERLLRSAPGIGPVITATLGGLLPELGRLGPKQAAAMTGLAPFAHESGTHTGLRYIVGGRAAVRTALFTAVIVGLRCNPVIQAHYQQLKARGKAHKVAVIACARRLLGILNAMIRDGLTWQQTKVGQGQFLTTNP